MSFLQAALIGIVSAVSYLEGGWLGECKFREPVVTGALVGIILGQPEQGLIIGAQLQLIFMGAASIGPTAGLSVGPGGTIGAAIALATNSGIEVAMTFAVPVSVMLQFMQTVIDTLYSPMMHKVDRLIDEGGKEKQIIGIHYLNLIITIVVYWTITFVALYAGNEIIAKVVDSIPAWVTSGLNAVAKVLPAMGFALLLNLLMDKDIIPYLIMGFALSSWMGLSMIAVATIALAVALVMYQIKSKDLELERRSFSDYEEEL